MKKAYGLIVSYTLLVCVSSYISAKENNFDEYSDFDKTRISSCLTRLEIYANGSRNLTPFPGLDEAWQRNFSKGYLYSAIPDFYMHKERFKSKFVKKEHQAAQVNSHKKTGNGWFDAMDCTRDLIAYGIMIEKVNLD
jgi:hypothetical protein